MGSFGHKTDIEPFGSKSACQGKLTERLSAGSGRLGTSLDGKCPGPSSLVERPEDLEVIKNPRNRDSAGFRRYVETPLGVKAANRYLVGGCPDLNDIHMSGRHGLADSPGQIVRLVRFFPSEGITRSAEVASGRRRAEDRPQQLQVFDDSGW
jgi:hypothetical protein